MKKEEFLGYVVLCSVLAFIFSYLEYYYITLDGIPYREIYRAEFLNIPPYVLFPFAPVLALAAFLPTINDLFSRRRDLNELQRKFVVSAANFLWAMTLLDVLYYVLRFAFPHPMDPLGGLWITPGEAPLLGLVNLLGILWPTWYFATIPAAISVYVAYHIS